MLCHSTSVCFQSITLSFLRSRHQHQSSFSTANKLPNTSRRFPFYYACLSSSLRRARSSPVSHFRHSYFFLPLDFGAIFLVLESFAAASFRPHLSLFFKQKTFPSRFSAILPHLSFFLPPFFFFFFPETTTHNLAPVWHHRANPLNNTHASALLFLRSSVQFLSLPSRLSSRRFQ